MDWTSRAWRRRSLRQLGLPRQGWLPVYRLAWTLWDRRLTGRLQYSFLADRTWYALIIGDFVHDHRTGWHIPIVRLPRWNFSCGTLLYPDVQISPR